MIQFDYCNIFQMGWFNHQLVMLFFIRILFVKRDASRQFFFWNPTIQQADWLFFWKSS